MQPQGSTGGSYANLSGYAADEAMRQVDDAVELAIRRHEQFSEAERRLEQLTVTEQSPDGVARVTVRSTGALVSLELSDHARTLMPRQLAAVVQQCVQQAQAGVVRRTEAILRDIAPGDPLTDELVSNVHKALMPRDPVEPPAQARPARSRTLPIGDIDGDIDDDPGGQSFMVRR